jgi:DNA polymerase
MKSLSIDLETFSDVDLNKSGVYRYTESPTFEILLFGFARDDDPVTVLDLTAGDTVPEDVLDALTDENVIKWAFNASFERICLSAYLRKYYPERFVTYSIPEDSVRNYLDPASWRCSMIWSAYLGLPLSLKGVGEALDLEEQKMAEGKELLRYFCTPCKPTKANGGRTRNLPSDAPDKWEVFKKYNRRDVEVEMSIKKHLRNFPVPESVWEEYHIDQEINDRGILVDLEMAEQAIAIDSRSRASLTEKLKKLTGLSNPNSVVQMKDWLSAHGLKTDTLGKKAVASLLETAPDDLKEVLKLRQQIAKSSVKKYQAMQNAACRDHRARGMFQFYGANRSGRFSGRLIQLQNLPQNHMPDLAEARALVKSGDYDSLDLLYDSVPNVLSELIRTAFIPRPGMKFIVSDFSSIEARVLAYLSGEQHTMDSFARGEDIYCATASAMFHKPVVKHGVNGELRQKGKIAVLACGYGGSVGALKAMGALDMGLQEEELQPIVDAWRAANPHITKFWWDVDRAVKEVIRTKGTREVRGIRFFYKSQMLFIHLPSGRDLAYVKPMIQPNQYGGESITYMGIGSTKKWERIESYGPKIVENITQAISRDILCYAMRTLSHCFICAHVHDELIIECGMDVSVDAVCEQMGRTPPWAPGLLLRADGYECEFYKKD